MKNSDWVICGKYRKLEKPKISYTLGKTLVLPIISIKYKNEDEKIFKEEELIEIFKIRGLTNNVEKYQNIQSCLKKT